jgi:hypothetical protein
MFGLPPAVDGRSFPTKSDRPSTRGRTTRRTPNYDKRLDDHAMSLWYQLTVEDSRRRPIRAPRSRK